MSEHTFKVGDRVQVLLPMGREVGRVILPDPDKRGAIVVDVDGHYRTWTVNHVQPLPLFEPVEMWVSREWIDSVKSIARVRDRQHAKYTDMVKVIVSPAEDQS